MPRRPWGSGQEFKRSDGRWVARGRRPDGTVVSGTSCRSLAEARARLRKNLEPRGPSTSSPSVAAYLARWLDDTAPHRLAPRSLGLYRSVVGDWISPHLGDIELHRLTPDDVEGMVNAVLAAGRSPQWARHCQTVLRSALKDAVRRGTIPDNPAARIDPVKVPRGEVVRLTAADVRRLLAANPEHDHRAIWVLALTTGMRRGEVLSLRWGDVDLERGTVTIAGTVLPVKPEPRPDGKRARRTRWRFVDTKTRTSRRTLLLSRFAVAELVAHRARKPPVAPPWFVFRRADGAPLAPDWVGRRWHDALVGIGLETKGKPTIPFHASRHTAAALMLDDSGGDLRLVSQTLGHSSLGTTVDRYGGIAERAMQKAAEAMDRMLEQTSVPTDHPDTRSREERA